MKYSLRSLMILVTLVAFSTWLVAYPGRVCKQIYDGRMKEASEHDAAARDRFVLASGRVACINQRECDALKACGEWNKEMAEMYRYAAWRPWMQVDETPMPRMK